ncbi:hypothetical protein [Agathobaculum sp.]
MNQTYGYIRVSTKEQNEARQLTAFFFHLANEWCCTIFGHYSTL